MRVLMRRFLNWLIGPSTIEPSPEQIALLEQADAFERKLEARRRDRERMFDLHVDVLTRQEPESNA